MPGLSASALCIPAREVGGDYYDFLPLDDHRVGILIADVSGKGTSAALYMAQLRGWCCRSARFTRRRARSSSPPTASSPSTSMRRSFITVTYAIVDVRARTMTYARAGHTPLIHVPGGERRDAPRAAPRRPNGMVVGLKLDERRDVRAAARGTDDSAGRPATSSCSSPTGSARR